MRVPQPQECSRHKDFIFPSNFKDEMKYILLVYMHITKLMQANNGYNGMNTSIQVLIKECLYLCIGGSNPFTYILIYIR